MTDPWMYEVRANGARVSHHKRQKQAVEKYFRTIGADLWRWNRKEKKFHKMDSDQIQMMCLSIDMSKRYGG